MKGLCCRFCCCGNDKEGGTTDGNRETGIIGGMGNNGKGAGGRKQEKRQARNRVCERLWISNAQDRQACRHQTQRMLPGPVKQCGPMTAPIRSGTENT